MSKGDLGAVLDSVRPTPIVEEIGGKEFEFWPLTLAEHAEIKKKTGKDLTQEMFRAKGAMDFVDSELLLEVLYRSMKKSKNDIVKELTREQTSDLVAYGLGGFSSVLLGEVFSFALSGKRPGTDKDEEGGSGNARKSAESDGN